jgi:hypothetical protein
MYGLGELVWGVGRELLQVVINVACFLVGCVICRLQYVT